MLTLEHQIIQMNGHVDCAIKFLIESLDKELSSSSFLPRTVNNGVLSILRGDYVFVIDINKFYLTQKDAENWDSFVGSIASGKAKKTSTLYDEDRVEWDDFVGRIACPKKEEVWKTEYDDIIDDMCDVSDKEVEDIYNIRKSLFQAQKDGRKIAWNIKITNINFPTTYRIAINEFALEIGFIFLNKMGSLKTVFEIFEKLQNETPERIAAFNSDTIVS